MNHKKWLVSLILKKKELILLKVKNGFAAYERNGGARKE